MVLAQYNSHAANQRAIDFCKPDSSVLIRAKNVLGNGLRYEGLETQPETGQVIVHTTMQGDDLSEITALQVVSYYYVRQ